jgi:hypothetical protein
MNQRGDMSENYYSDMIDVKGSKIKNPAKPDFYEFSLNSFSRDLMRILDQKRAALMTQNYGESF